MWATLPSGVGADKGSHGDRTVGGGRGGSLSLSYFACQSQLDLCQLPWRPSLPPPGPAMSTESHTGDLPRAACGRGGSGSREAAKNRRFSFCLFRFCNLSEHIGFFLCCFPAAKPTSAFALSPGCCGGWAGGDGPGLVRFGSVWFGLVWFFVPSFLRLWL